MIYEMCQKNLFQHFKEEVNHDEVVMELRKILTAHIFPAIIFLHENNIVHGDIKADNIMFSNRHWKLIDFGVATHNMDVSRGGSYIPPEHRRAFELKQEARATVKVDSFSLGVMMMEIVSTASICTCAILSFN